MSCSWVSSRADFEARGLCNTDALRIKWDVRRFLPFVMHFYHLTLGDKLAQMEKEGQLEAAKPLKELHDNVAFEFGLGSGIVQDFILLVGRKSDTSS